MTLWERDGDALVDVENPMRRIPDSCDHDGWKSGCLRCEYEAREARRLMDAAGAYDLDDPKHPTYHDRYAAIADDR